MTTIPQRYRQTDGQADGQITCHDVPLYIVVAKSIPLHQGSANFLGSRTLAAGRTGKFYLKILITVDLPIPLIMMSCHICKSTERKSGDFWYFVQDCFKINSTSFQLYTIFSNFTKKVTEGSSVKGVSQRQRVNECKRADQRWLSVCD